MTFPKHDYHDYVEDRVGQLVRPSEAFPHRPICEVISSEVRQRMGQWDTYHIVKYPDSQHRTGSKVGIWESEWPAIFVELGAVSLRHYQETVAADSEVIIKLRQFILDIRSYIEQNAWGLLLSVIAFLLCNF